MYIIMQAPASMKAVVQAGWLLTVAGGNIIDVIVAGSQLLPTQVSYLNTERYTKNVNISVVVI